MKVRPYISRGRRYWRLDYGLVDGKRRIKQFPTRADADAALSVARAERAAHGIAAIAELTPIDRSAFAAARDSLGRVGATITEAVLHYHATAPAERVTINRAVDEFMAAKSAGGLRPRYVGELGKFCRRLARDHGDTPIVRVTAGTLEQWMRRPGSAASTLRTHRSMLSALMSFASRRGWIRNNPVAGMEPIRSTHKPPAILNVESATRLLEATRITEPGLLSVVALGMFCGIRPHEIARLPWGAVDLARGIVTVDAAASKVHRRRIVDIPPVALPWLTIEPRTDRSESWMYGRLKRCAAVAGVRWSHDLLRHTAASYMMSRDRDAGRVADQLGNSPAILLRHYRELVPADESAAFWEINPPT